jgi:proteasome lid subunit RPN8/RPN11
VLQLPKKFADEIIAHAFEEDPKECCGVLAGPKARFIKRFPMTNVDQSPYRFSWDPKELLKVYLEMEDNAWEHRAVYHSHTHSPAYPSDTDVRMAGWPEAYYLIVSLEDKTRPVIRAFRIVDGKISEETLQVV